MIIFKKNKLALYLVSLFFVFVGISNGIPTYATESNGEACTQGNECDSGICQGSICVGKKLGTACDSDSQCKSSHCEDSFCDCKESPSEHSKTCAAEYGLTSDLNVEAPKWRCEDEGKDPDKNRKLLDFCVTIESFGGPYPPHSNSDVKYPIERKAYMGEPCYYSSICLSQGTGGDDVCNDTGIQSIQSNDPWYEFRSTVHVCECMTAIAYNPTPVCSAQYGPGNYTCEDGPIPDTGGTNVCRRSDGWIPESLEDMAKWLGPPLSGSEDNSNNPNQTTIFGFDVTIPNIDPVQPAPKIGIPGVVFSKISKESSITTDEDGTSWLNVPFLGEYISAIYKYSVGLISLIAVMVLIISGVQIITSAGSSEMISAAKHRIVSSVIAIALTAGSYTILYTINPDLVNLRNLKIVVVAGNTNYFSASPEDENAVSDPEVASNPDDKTPSFLPSDPIRIYDAKGAGPWGAKYLANCSMFPSFNVSSVDGKKARIECRKACNAQLSEEWKSKRADTSYSDKYLGSMDCSVQAKGRSPASIKYIAIHEGGPGAIDTWWSSNVREQKPVGSHYFITPDGQIHQIASEDFEIWHGVYNPTSIGIDLSVSGKGCAGGGLLPPEEVKGCTYTQYQYDSLNELINDITGRLGGRRPKILGHCEYPKNNHVDPRNFEWSKIFGETNAEHRNTRCAYVPGYTFGVKP